MGSLTLSLLTSIPRCKPNSIRLTFFQAVASSPLLQSFGIAVYTPFPDVSPLDHWLCTPGDYDPAEALLTLARWGAVSHWWRDLVIGLMVPMWVEVAGYAAEGLAIAWSAVQIWHEHKPIARAELVA